MQNLEQSQPLQDSFLIIAGTQAHECITCGMLTAFWEESAQNTRGMEFEAVLFSSCCRAPASELETLHLDHKS